MPVSSAQGKLRVSLFYLGSALFLGTGVVSIADQPLVNQRLTFCAGCTANNFLIPCQLSGIVCTGAVGPTTCNNCTCFPTPPAACLP
jgi:hypothetical protein